MRSAKTIVKEYRKKGYSAERLRLLAASREEPLRSQILAEIEASEPDDRKKSGRKHVGVLLETEKVGALPGLSDGQSALPEDLPGLFAGQSAPEDEGEKGAESCESVLAELEDEMNGKEDQTLTLVIEECIEFQIDGEGAPAETDEVEVELEEAKAGDILESAELILSAYHRAGMEVEEPDFQSAQDGGEYVAPVLTVIECEGAPEAEDDGMLHLQPEYALTPEQREAAEEREMEQRYDIIAKTIEADFARLTRERLAEEPQLPCEDFDDLARPAEEDWAAEPVFVTVEEESMGSAAAEVELARLRGWLNELEDGLKMRTLEQNRLQADLNDRDETVVVMGRQLASVEGACAAIAEQSRHDSEVIARTQNVLSEQRARLEILHVENTQLNEDVLRARGYLENNNTIISAQSTEVLQLRCQLEDLNVGAGKLVTHNRQLEALLAGREKETAALRSELQAQAGRIEELALRDQESLRYKERLEELQLEYNILTSEVLPGLQADKEELVEFVGEESDRCIQLQTVAAQRARRSSYSIAIAAAACLMMVLTPAFSWHNQEIERLKNEEAYGTRLAQAESVQQALRAERNDINNRLQSVQAQYNQEREEWSARLVALTEGGSGVPDSQVRAVKTSDGGAYDPALFDMPPTTGNDGGAKATHYNGITNVDEWRLTQDTRTVREPGEQPEDKVAVVVNNADAYKTVKVRRGEGLSQVLWRVYGNSSPEMLRHVAKLNKLSTDKRGNPSLQMDQQLKLPADPRTAMLTD